MEIFYVPGLYLQLDLKSGDKQKSPIQTYVGMLTATNYLHRFPRTIEKVFRGFDTAPRIRFLLGIGITTTEK